MKCSNLKCRKQLTPYGGSSAICRCMNCKQYFCENEGEILKEDKWIEAVKGNTNRTIYDFLCYGCEAKEKALKEQNKSVARITDERERAEMLEKQRLHSSDMLKADYEELEKLPKIGNTISDMKKGFHGEVRSCSVYDKLYGSKWPSKDTKIYLTFSHYNQSSNYYERPIKTTEYYCLLCVKRFLKDWWIDLERGWLFRNVDRVREKFPNTFN